MKPIYLGLTVAGVLVAGFGMYLYNQYKKALNYAYKIKSFTLEKVTKNDMIVNFVLKIKNKSSIKAVITGYDFELFLNNIKIGNVSSDKVQAIDSKGISELAMRFQFNPLEVFDLGAVLKLIGQTSFEQDKVYFELKGTLSGKIANAIELSKQPIDIKMTLKELLEPTPESEEEVW